MATKTKSEKKSKTVKASANGKPSSKKTSPNGNVDKFGSRIGTAPAKANAVLSTKPKPMSQIKEEAGLDVTVYDHFNRLIKKGFVTKTDDGFCLAKKK